MAYGTILTADSATKQLKQYNESYNRQNVWNDLLSQNANSALAAENELLKSYNTATADAYVSYLKNQNAIINSGAVGQGRTNLLQDNELALQDAYNSYMNSLQEGTASIQESYSQSNQAVENAFAEQGEYTAAYDKAHMDYLQELWERYENGENTLFDTELWSRYTTQDQLRDEETGELLYDEEGNPVLGERRLKARDELFNASYDEVLDDEGNLVGKDWTGFVDDQGNLTLKGVDFYDQIENAMATEGGYSFGEYLSDTNPDLLDWANSYNPYDYTDAGTNAGTFKTMTGRMSTDYLYSFAERFGGMSEKEINNLYSSFQESSQQLVDAINNDDGYDSKDIVKSVNNMFGDLSKMAEDLGIDADFEAETSMSLAEFGDKLSNMLANAKSESDINWSTLGVLGNEIVMGAGTGALMGGTVGLAAASTGIGAVTAPGVFAAGTIGGAVIGLFLGAIKAQEANENMVNYNKQIAKQSKEVFDNALQSMLQYSLRKKRQAEIDFNKTLY